MSKKLQIINVVGARPNFMKAASLLEEMHKSSSIMPILVHTGQHYDERMSKTFFKDLGLPKPQIDLGVGSGSHAQQTAEIMVRFESVLDKNKPDLVVVFGDVNSTIACALTSVKLGIPVAHVEAGLRSFDRGMPEEVNRILTDAISDSLFTTEQSANENLLREGTPQNKIYFVGNLMIDTLLRHKRLSQGSTILQTLHLTPESYGILTLHRPNNVDERDTFQEVLKTLCRVGPRIQIIFPCHPRTKMRIESFGLQNYFHVSSSPSTTGIHLIDPLGYLDFIRLMSEARFVLTDSGGIQEETTVLGVPCLTLRENTERPVTVTKGTNVIVGTDPKAILENIHQALNGYSWDRCIPDLWDGKSSERVIKVLVNKYRSKSGGEKLGNLQTSNQTLRSPW